MYKIIVALTAVLVSCTSIPSVRAPAADAAAPAVDPNAIHVIATTDLHGYILAQEDNNHNAYGGIDAMSGLFKIGKNADPDTLLLDSGDLYQGTIVSNTTEGKTVVTWMNYAGYTAAAIGNHDFDFGPAGKDGQVLHKGQHPLGALKARIAQAHFAMLSANICSIKEDRNGCKDQNNYPVASFAKPYITKIVHGAKVGIIGLTTTTTPETTMASNVADLRFLPLENALNRFVPEMVAEGVETVIVVAHEGAACLQGKCDPKERMSVAIDNLKPEVRAKISLFLAGHTHNFVDTVYNGVHVMINGSYGRSFGYVTLARSGDGFVVTSTRSVEVCTDVYTATNACRVGSGDRQPAKFLGQTVVADRGALDVIADDVKLAEQKAAEIVGHLKSDLNAGKDTVETTLGDFVADAIRLCGRPQCDGPVADVSFQNGTGLRIKHIAAGDVTYGQIFELLPFDNAVAEVKMTGSQIHDLINMFYYYNHNNMNDVSGLKISYAAVPARTRTAKNTQGESRDFPDAVDVITLADGSAFDESKTYTVALADYLAEGGSGTQFLFAKFSPPPVIDHNRNFRDAIIDYLKKNPDGLDYAKLGGGRLLRSGTPAAK